MGRILMDSARPVRQFYLLLLVTILLKVVLAGIVPITGDEAYFALWGKNLSYGYYDHPPMPGWLQALTRSLGHQTLVVRLPAVILSSLTAIALFHYLCRKMPDRALALAVAYLFLPFTLVAGFLFSTDTFLLPTFLVATILFARGIETERVGPFILSGLITGLALLTKYFTGLLVIGLVAAVLSHPRRRHLFRGLIAYVVFAGMVFLVNLVWNYFHCWDNIMFNLINRHGEARPNLFTPLIYLITVPWAFSPALAYYIWRHRAAQGSRQMSRAFLFGSVVPLSALLAISLWRDVGLHWVLGYISLGYIALAPLLKPETWKSIARFNVLFGVVHLLVVVVAVLFGPRLLSPEHTTYKTWVASSQGDAMTELLTPYQEEFVLASSSYSFSSILEFVTDVPVTVFGKGSFHARQHDILTDFRELAGRDIMVVMREGWRRKRYGKYFSRVETDTVTIKDARFFLMRGYAFDYEGYATRFLRAIDSLYYRIPSWLPAGSCYFHDRYSVWLAGPPKRR